MIMTNNISVLNQYSTDPSMPLTLVNAYWEEAMLYHNQNVETSTMEEESLQSVQRTTMYSSEF